MRYSTLFKCKNGMTRLQPQFSGEASSKQRILGGKFSKAFSIVRVYSKAHKRCKHIYFYPSKKNVSFNDIISRTLPG